jgi:myosin-15
LESHQTDRLAISAFHCIQRFMGDQPLRRGRKTFTDCVYELLSVCHAYPLMRDEVYCQLVKQLSGNGSVSSAQRGWRLVSILCAYFPPTETLKPYLLRFLQTWAYDRDYPYQGS